MGHQVFLCHLLKNPSPPLQYKLHRGPVVCELAGLRLGHLVRFWLVALSPGQGSRFRAAWWGGCPVCVRPELFPCTPETPLGLGITLTTSLGEGIDIFKTLHP